MLNWTYHKPTMEVLIGPSAGEVAASCLPTAEITIGFPAAIAAKLSPQEAYAPALSPITKAHSTSFVQVPAKMFFIILLLLDFELSNKAVKGLAPPSARSRPYLCLACNLPTMQSGSRTLHFHNTV